MHDKPRYLQEPTAQASQASRSTNKSRCTQWIANECIRDQSGCGAGSRPRRHVRTRGQPCTCNHSRPRSVPVNPVSTGTHVPWYSRANYASASRTGHEASPTLGAYAPRTAELVYNCTAHNTHAAPPCTKRTQHTIISLRRHQTPLLIKLFHYWQPRPDILFILFAEAQGRLAKQPLGSSHARGNKLLLRVDLSSSMYPESHTASSAQFKPKSSRNTGLYLAHTPACADNSASPSTDARQIWLFLPRY